MNRRRFELGLFYPNSSSVHFLSDEAAALNPDCLSVKAHVGLARSAERAGLDYLFIADAWGSRGVESSRIGLMDPTLFPPVLAGALFAATDSIRVITTIHLSWLHPVHILRMSGTLDALGAGRWGMNMVAGAGFAEHLIDAVGTPKDHDERYAAAAEAMDIIVMGWSNGGHIDYDGTYYQVHGAVVGPMPPTVPHPALVSAGASAAGRSLAAKYASYVFLPGRASKEMVEERSALIREEAASLGRDPDQIKFLLHASILVRESQAEADEVVASLRETISRPAVAEYMTAVSAIQTYEDMYESYTDDQVLDVGLTAGTRAIHGSPDLVVDQLTEMKEDMGCDGVSLSFPLWHPPEIEQFDQLVIPRLIDRDVWSPLSTT